MPYDDWAWLLDWLWTPFGHPLVGFPRCTQVFIDKIFYTHENIAATPPGPAPITLLLFHGLMFAPIDPCTDDEVWDNMLEIMLEIAESRWENM